MNRTARKTTSALFAPLALVSVLALGACSDDADTGTDTPDDTSSETTDPSEDASDDADDMEPSEDAS